MREGIWGAEMREHRKQMGFGRRPQVARALQNEAMRLRLQAAELEQLLGGGDRLLCGLAAGMRKRAAAAERLAMALLTERVAA